MAGRKAGQCAQVKKKSGKGEEREENFALIRLQQSDPLHSSEDLKLRALKCGGRQALLELTRAKTGQTAV